MTRLQSRLPSRLLGLLATLGLAGFAVGTPVVLLAIGALPSFDSFHWSALTSPDDGTVALALMQWGAWIAWAVMSATLLIEVIAAVRGIRAPRIPGLPQAAAGRLVALAALLFVATPTVQAAQPAPSEAAPFPVSLAARIPAAATTPVAASSTPPSVTRADEVHWDTVRYVTRRNDSLWKIAEEHLGDGRRYVELIELNADVLHGRPDFIAAGLSLRLPAEAGREQHADPAAYVVQPGDTLSEIAEESLGEPMRYPEIFRASRDTVQPDGERIMDPDLIQPGWTLTIPGTTSDEAQSQSHPDRPRPPSTPALEDPTPAPTVPTPAPGPTAGLPPQSESPSAEQSAPADHAQPDETEVPGWVLPGLTGGGALLAGSLLLVVRAHRRTQLRYRRPGHVIALPPPELLPVEKTLHLAGTPSLPRIETLDALLRSLGAATDTAPALSTIELSAREAVLHLAGPADLPAPWRGSGDRWTADLTTDAAADPDAPAPYPLLVTVGQSDDGHLWLVDLEPLEAITIGGCADQAEAFARHVIAELAVNPWATRVEIHAVGIGAELDSISYRLNQHGGEDTGLLEPIKKDLTCDDDTAYGDPETFYAVATTERLAGLEAVRDLIAAHPGRAGAVVIAVNLDDDCDPTAFDLTATGRLRVAALGLDVLASGLTSDEATACAAIVDLTQFGDNSKVPVDESADEGVEVLIDAGGAVRAELTEPRPDGPAGEASLLPRSSADYEEQTGTTVEDVEALAPVTPRQTRRRIEEADPPLDEDLAAWHDKDAKLPKLTLLGTVSARAYGDYKVVSTRKPFYVELLAYLVLHPHGVTADQVATAFGLTKDRAYVDLTNLRKWLGADPRTGQKYLPPLKATRGSRAPAESTYRVTGVLSDYDLFRRLRARGQARGSAGMPDLVEAIDLVTGEPFTQLRETGWSWLLEGERVDHTITCAVVDVGHVVKTHALSVDDFDLARAAAERTYTAAPYDEVARLDLIEVAHASGHADLAERHLVDGIFNRSDDHSGPIAVPRRTAKMVQQLGRDRKTDGAPR